MLFGGLQLWLASVVRHETHEQARPAAIRAPQPVHVGRLTWPRPCPPSTRRPPRRRLRPTAWGARPTPAIARSSCRSTARTSPMARSRPPRRSPLGSGPPSTPSPSRSRTSSCRRIRIEAARSLGTGPDDPRIHVEVDTDVAGAVQRRASELDSCLVCLSTHGRGRIAGTLVGSTARDIIERGHHPVVVAGPFVVHPDPAKAAIPPLGVDRLVACVDGTPASERGLPVAAAWAHALGMKLTIVTVAEPSPPPVRIGAPWRRHHGPNEDADEYIRRLGGQVGARGSGTGDLRRLRPDQPRGWHAGLPRRPSGRPRRRHQPSPRRVPTPGARLRRRPTSSAARRRPPSSCRHNRWRHDRGRAS